MPQQAVCITESPKRFSIPALDLHLLTSCLPGGLSLQSLSRFLCKIIKAHWKCPECIVVFTQGKNSIHLPTGNAFEINILVREENSEKFVIIQYHCDNPHRTALYWEKPRHSQASEKLLAYKQFSRTPDSLQHTLVSWGAGPWRPLTQHRLGDREFHRDISSLKVLFSTMESLFQSHNLMIVGNSTWKICVIAGQYYRAVRRSHTKNKIYLSSVKVMSSAPVITNVHIYTDQARD